MIYLLEDDESIRKLVVYALKSQDYDTEGFENQEQFWAAMAKKTPELILLDIMLPGEDGITILKRIRKSADTADIPVIILTAKNTEYDRVEGLDAGADDYISKPFGIMELAARVRAVLRRRTKEPTLSEYNIGPLFICPERHETRVNGEDIALTYKEFMLLRILVENMGIVMSREVLLDRVWGLGSERENRTLDVHIRTLRSKLGPAGQLIQTVRGIGYRLVEE
ncbi:MAG: response regulator transcription factor [Clostridiales bacterium]|nr:response regulator transcription factor [Clostridiales bacterium]MBR4819402.1 response regulator transcription factor [Clostridiales bacterium]MBR5058499.1 response regulator transcription factor [Clostridiales bacterium]